MTKGSATDKAVALLHSLIATPSFSGEEADTASILYDWSRAQGWQPERIGNNILIRNARYHPSKPSLLLCSHHDTVPPSPGYTRPPFVPTFVGDKLYGLGSNDAGAALVSLLTAFGHFYEKRDLPFNLIMDCGAEEETSGPGGQRRLTDTLRREVSMALIGEPTGMKAAIAERGLLVLDGTTRGRAGHAALDQGENALYKAVDDIRRLRNFTFDRISPVMGSVHLAVTQMQAGSAHNVIPDICRFVVDIRITERYTPREILTLLQAAVGGTLTARRLTHKASVTPQGHPLLQTVARMGMETFISPTTSDWTQFPWPALKMGPGESIRSHSADEYIRLSELASGITTYIAFIQNLASVYAHTME